MNIKTVVVDIVNSFPVPNTEIGKRIGIAKEAFSKLSRILRKEKNMKQPYDIYLPVWQ